MVKKISAITLSLSGICQSIYLVQQLARSGTCDHHAFKTCLKSILEINPISVIKIYGNHEKNLNIGLKTLLSLLTFSSFSYSYAELIRYIFDMLIIEEKLKKKHLATVLLRKKIFIVSQEYKLNHDFDFLINQLAKIYVDIIGNLSFRITIKGEKRFLQDLQIKEKIRCLLFSGIRSIFLWRQFGGNQLKLIFFRYYIIQKTKQILYNLNKST